MSILNQNIILPGAITDIESDYSYGYDTSQFGTTDSIVIIGTAFNGPVGKPVEIYSPEHARYIFGETYDSTTKQEATLVESINDAYSRGARTIYAVRVSGKSINKDFQFRIDSNLKLRVSGLFPSNSNKNIYMRYEESNGDLIMTIFKPSSRATITEKMTGMVESDSSIMSLKFNLTGTYGLTKDSTLVEAINIINSAVTNNVLRLGIINEEGIDVTITSKEAQALPLGALFQGIYFLGRDVNKTTIATNLYYDFATANKKPFSSFDGVVFKTLQTNTDINMDLPIYDAAGLAVYNVLTTSDAVDNYYGKNSIDYEEVTLNDFDIYKKLGSGFATTAKAVYKDPADPTKGIKVIETPTDNANRVVAIEDGIYPIIENLTAKYRVVTNGCADAVIKGKLPKKDSFRMSTNTVNTIFKNNVKVTSKVNPSDLTEPKAFSINVGNFTSTGIAADLYTTKVIKHVAKLALATDVVGKTYPNGTLFFVTSGLVYNLGIYSNGTLTIVKNTPANVAFKDKLFLVDGSIYELKAGTADGAAFEFEKITTFVNKFALVESGGHVAIYSVDATTFAALPIGPITETLDADTDKTLISVQDIYGTTNTIRILSTEFDYTSLSEFVDMLNENAILKELFTFELTEDGQANKDEYLDALITATTVELDKAYAIAADKVIGYDINLYVPYKTTDNFARQLAQHCTYTSMKTAPTHGIIGCETLLDTSLNSIANKVNSLIELDLNLYAKKPNGRDMLDKNNLPYPIGRDVSVVVGQYSETFSDDNYTYMSNGAAGYAGMVSILDLDQSSTSQTINIPTPLYDFSNFQLEKLTQKGYVTFKQSYTKGYVVTDGITMAPTSSPFKRLSVTRIINSIEEMIRAAVEPYIGKQNHLANRNSMSTSIKASLENIKGKLIEGYNFTVSVDTKSTDKMGIVYIDYDIVPIYEIRQVSNRIQVKNSL